MREFSARHVRDAVLLTLITLLIAGCFQPAGSGLQPTGVDVADLTRIATVELATPTSLPADNLTPFITPIPSEGPPTAEPPTIPPPPSTTEAPTQPPEPPPPTQDQSIQNPITPTDAGPTPTPTLSIPTLDATPTQLLPPTPTGLPTDNPCEYTVQQGEYPYSIARKLNINPVDLINANPGVQNRILQPGDKLRVPNCNPQAAAPPPAEPTNPPAAQAQPTQPPPATNPVGAPTAIILTDRIYTVAAGDTLGGIARKFGVTVQALKDANGIVEGDFLRIGQQLKIPAPGQ